MVQMKKKNNRNVSVSRAVPVGAKVIAPPLVTRGESKVTGAVLESEHGNQLVREGRERLNLSVGQNVKKAVVDLAGVLGMTESQLVVHALLMAFPQLRQQALSVQSV